MLNLLRETWPFFGLIAVFVLPMMLSDALDLFFPGCGWMIVAYGIGSLSVSYVVWTIWKNW